MGRKFFLNTVKLFLSVLVLLLSHRLLMMDFGSALPTAAVDYSAMRGHSRLQDEGPLDNLEQMHLEPTIIVQNIVKETPVTNPIQLGKLHSKYKLDTGKKQGNPSAPHFHHHMPKFHAPAAKVQLARRIDADSPECILQQSASHEADNHLEISWTSTAFWLRLTLIFGLLCIAGLMAGLTIGIMALDTNYLHILKVSGSPLEKHYAAIVEPMRKKGHMLLSTLLIANMLANESLPIILDEMFSDGGYLAVITSTALIVLFAEIIPQAVCSKYGLVIAAHSAWLLNILMFILMPITWPIAKTLEFFLGKHEGTVYKRDELKEFVALHGKDVHGDLDADEVRIIKSVLDLQRKRIKDIMTPLVDVFMLDMDSRLDNRALRLIKAAGYSRIPIFSGDRTNIVGVLLTKDLLAMSDSRKIRDLRYLMRPILYFSVDDTLFHTMDKFLDVKAHMAVIYCPNMYLDGNKINSAPVANTKKNDEAVYFADHNIISANDDEGFNVDVRKPQIHDSMTFTENFAETTIVGILTLEDVLEEMIGEEIVDETDLFVNQRSKAPVLRRHHSVSGSHSTSVLKWRKRKLRKRKHRKEDMFPRRNSTGTQSGFVGSKSLPSNYYVDPAITKSGRNMKLTEPQPSAVSSDSTPSSSSQINLIRPK